MERSEKQRWERIQQARSKVTVQQFIDECNMQIRDKMQGARVMDYGRDLHDPLRTLLNPYIQNLGMHYGVWRICTANEDKDFDNMYFKDMFVYRHELKRDKRYVATVGTILRCGIQLSDQMSFICSKDDTIEVMLKKLKLFLKKRAVDVQNEVIEETTATLEKAKETAESLAQEVRDLEKDLKIS